MSFLIYTSLVSYYVLAISINDELSDKEIRELEELERREGKSKLDDN